MRIKLAETGRFLAVVPASVLKFSAKSTLIKMLPVDLPTTRRQIGIIMLKNRTLSPLAQLFIDCAHEVAKPLAKGDWCGEFEVPISRGKFVYGLQIQNRTRFI